MMGIDEGIPVSHAARRDCIKCTVSLTVIIASNCVAGYYCTYLPVTPLTACSADTQSAVNSQALARYFIFFAQSCSLPRCVQGYISEVVMQS